MPAERFYNAYHHGFARVAACTAPTAIADPARNADSIVAVARELHDDGVALGVFPELAVSGYALEDLLLQQPLLETVGRELTRIVDETASLTPVLVVGAPLAWRNRLYNCAVVIHRGRERVYA